MEPSSNPDDYYWMRQTKNVRYYIKKSGQSIAKGKIPASILHLIPEKDKTEQAEEIYLQMKKVEQRRDFLKNLIKDPEDPIYAGTQASLNKEENKYKILKEKYDSFPEDVKQVINERFASGNYYRTQYKYQGESKYSSQSKPRYNASKNYTGNNSSQPPPEPPPVEDYYKPYGKSQYPNRSAGYTNNTSKRWWEQYYNNYTNNEQNSSEDKSDSSSKSESPKSNYTGPSPNPDYAEDKTNSSSSYSYTKSSTSYSYTKPSTNKPSASKPSARPRTHIPKSNPSGEARIPISYPKKLHHDILKEYNITDRSSWKKWLIKNHPDKNPDIKQDIVKTIIEAGQLIFPQ
jgi:hypothetical protein